jgi:hypothetical protein
MTDESIGAWDPQSDPDPEPGQPPKNVTPMQRPQPPGEQPRARDPNAPPFQHGGIEGLSMIPPRLAWVTLWPPYETMKVFAQINFPKKRLERAYEMTTGLPNPDEAGISDEEADRRRALLDKSQEAQVRVLSEFIRDHNFADEDGVKLPPTNTIAFWEQVGDDVAAAAISAVQAEVGRLDPPKRRR